MVHGIGQRLEKSNLVDDVGNFRHITASLAERHLTSHQRGTQRVLYIPCQVKVFKVLSFFIVTVLCMSKPFTRLVYNSGEGD